MYGYTMRSIKNKEMISKINANYPATFTVEELLSNVSFLNKFRIPFVICGSISLALTIFNVRCHHSHSLSNRRAIRSWSN